MRLPAKVAAIQLEGDSVRVVVVKTGGKKPVVLEQHEGRAEYADIEKRHDALVVAIRDTVGRVSSQPAGFVLCVSSLYTISRLITVPFRGRQRIAKTVRFELEPHLAFPVDDVLVDFVVANEHEGTTEVLAVGLRKETLAPMLDLLEEAGVKIESALPDVSGLTGLWWGAAKRGTSPIGVLHVRPDRYILTVVHRKSLAYIRQITRTVADIDEDPATVAREAQNTLRAFQAQWQGEEEIELFAVTGYDPSPENRAAFDDAMSVPVIFEDLSSAYTAAKSAQAPPSIIPMSDDDEPGEPMGRRPDFGDWSDIVGTAMVSAGTDFAFDFRRDELATTHSLEGIARHLAFSGVIAAIALIGFAIFGAVQYQQNRAQVAAMGDQMWELYTRAKPDSPFTLAGRPANDFGGSQTFAHIHASEEYELLMDAMGTDGDFSIGELSAAMFARPTLLEHLIEISTYMPGDEVKITDIRIAGTRGSTSPRLTIQGEVISSNALDRIYDRLRENAKTFTVEGRPASSMGQDGVARFTFSAAL